MKSRRPSAKSKSRVGTATNRPQSGKSNVSFQEDDLKEKLMTHTYAFTGYNLGDSLLHVNGDQSYLFPDGKGLIKIEKTRFIQGNLCVQVSVMMRGHTFCVNLANPVDEDALDEVVEQVKEANSNECDMVNKIPSIKTTDFGKNCVPSRHPKFRKIVMKMSVFFWSLFRFCLLDVLKELKTEGCSFSRLLVFIDPLRASPQNGQTHSNN